MSCESCPLKGNPKFNIDSSYQPLESDILVISESPTRSEVRLSTSLGGIEGKIFKATIQSTDLNLENIKVNYACLCVPNKDAKGRPIPPKEAIDCCRDRLLSEMKGYKKVLVMGSTAIQSVQPTQGSSTKCRGRAIWLDTIQAPVLFTYNPREILSNTDLYTDFAKDIEKLAGMTGKKDEVMPIDPGISHYCRNIRDIKYAVEKLSKSDLVVCDLETTDLDPIEGEIVLMGLRGSLEEDFHIPNNLLLNSQVVSLLSKILDNLLIKTGGHNIGFDAKWVKHKLGIDWRPQIDTMLAHYCLDERSSSDDSGQRGSKNLSGVHSLKVIAREKYNAPAWEEILKTELKSKKSKNYGDSDPEVLSIYLANDTLYTYLLAHDLVDEMIKDNVIEVHDKILVPGALTFRDIELLGTKLDKEYLKEVDIQLETESQQALKEVLEFATSVGMPKFNPNSPKQLGGLLFDKMGCPEINKRSTDKEVMSQLAETHPICKKIVEYRQKQKLRGTYTNGLITRCNSDGRIRGSFLLHGTVTGRLACSNPNLQNIPSILGPLIKKAFVATPGWTMIDADYSQLELRVAGWYSNDPTLIRCYNEGVDIHVQVAADIFHKKPEEVTKAERYIAKFVDFGRP